MTKRKKVAVHTFCAHFFEAHAKKHVVLVWFGFPFCCIIQQVLSYTWLPFGLALFYRLASYKAAHCLLHCSIISAPISWAMC